MAEIEDDDVIKHFFSYRLYPDDVHNRNLKQAMEFETNFREKFITPPYSMSRDNRERRKRFTTSPVVNRPFTMLRLPKGLIGNGINDLEGVYHIEKSSNYSPWFHNYHHENVKKRSARDPIKRVSGSLKDYLLNLESGDVLEIKGQKIDKIVTLLDGKSSFDEMARKCMRLYRKPLLEARENLERVLTQLYWYDLID